MAIYSRSTVIDAPLEEVWDFHSTVAGVVRVSPDWLHLRVDSVVGPEGDPDPPRLEVGTDVSLSIRPFDGGPRIAWTSRIVDREFAGTTAHFTDDMRDGPFPTWTHTHRFVALDGQTRLTDRVEYQLPLGPLTGLSALARPGFQAIFRDRHRRTRAAFR